MAKRVTVPISAARKTLFQLTDMVRKSGDDTVVLLEQRGTTERVALVREARLAYLEAQAAELDKRTDKPFKLVGSLKTNLDDEALEEALRQIRREWTPGVRGPSAATNRPKRKVVLRRK
jgi:hypothetical protein